jgi:hypothetical protein
MKADETCDACDEDAFTNHFAQKVSNRIQMFLFFYKTFDYMQFFSFYFLFLRFSVVPILYRGADVLERMSS